MAARDIRPIVSMKDPELNRELDAYRQGEPQGSSAFMIQTLSYGAEAECNDPEILRTTADPWYESEEATRGMSSNPRRYRGTTLFARWHHTKERWRRFDDLHDKYRLCRGCGLSILPLMDRDEARTLLVDDPIWWTWSECKMAAALGLRKPDWWVEDVDDHPGEKTDLEVYLAEGRYRLPNGEARRHLPYGADRPIQMGSLKEDDRYCHDSFALELESDGGEDDEGSDVMSTGSLGGSRKEGPWSDEGRDYESEEGGA
eukprot:CAMPEP_0182570074 /NCGR_PEP_ID=MMETSP1324-20130603/10506_1 /TAXON_ID=236786 /ORGANISM="Florenciella sp., Strain RCC1587" /LENGTH=257 /DNA_ID=CAMNT_0024784419 /DNA_START=63 /DNA_END=836 /DNA_ORIENTATION=-